MAKERTQLNINIDPQLLLKLKSEAIKSGKTLTDFVIEQLTNHPKKSIGKGSLEERLLRIERLLNLDNNEPKEKNVIGAIFSDNGAKKYGEVAKAIFESHIKKKGIDVQSGLIELSDHLKNYPHSNPELVFHILLGEHDLTGLEMTKAYRHGSCTMREALNDWTNSSCEELNRAFLDAVITKSLSEPQ